jgi:hypothetical protein
VDELLRRFRKYRVRYLLIGGQAVRLHGLARFSMDWDFFIPAHDTANLARINAALADVTDEAVEPLGPRGQNFVQTFQTPWGLVQFHLGAPGLPPFDAAERRAVRLKTETGTRVRCLSGADLLACKRAVNRPRDQLDILFLEAQQRAGKLR